MRWLNKVLLTLLLTCSANAAYVVTQSGRQINGSKISANEEGSVILTTSTGQQMTFRKGQYRTAVIDQPKELAQAQELIEAGKGDEALPLLKKIQINCRFLGWDEKATRIRADYFYDSGQFSEAMVEFQSLEPLGDPVVTARLRESLLKSGNLEQVLPALEKDIASGSRETAARAYLMRGDLKAANGDTDGARRDWLKVATFFTAQKERASEAEEKLAN